MKTIVRAVAFASLLFTAGISAKANDTSILKNDKNYIASQENITAEKSEMFKKNGASAKTFSSNNNKAVKIYPDIVKREMHVVAKENASEIDFFVFDTQGTLVQHYKMNQKEHKRITGLAPGKYIYRVFSGDTESASGKFEIR